MKKATIILTLILLSSLALAEVCFLEQDSPYYCQDIPETIAQIECELLECIPPTKTDSCINHKECEKILCAATCREEFRGLCLSGEITSKNACESGCCQVDDFCQEVRSLGECQIKAHNRKVNSFNFAVKTAATCRDFCADPTENKLIVNKFPTKPFPQLPAKVQKEFIPSKQEEPLEKKSSTPLLILLLLLSAMVVAFFISEEIKKRKRNAIFTKKIEGDSTPQPIQSTKHHHRPKNIDHLKKLEKITKKDKFENLEQLIDLQKKSKESVFKKLKKLAKK